MNFTGRRRQKGKDRHPHLIILDMYRSEPSGVDVLKTIRHRGYHGRVLLLSGHSMTSVLHDAYPIGVDKVVQVPEKVAGHFDFGELECAIDMCLKCNLQQERAHYQAAIAKRAHELFEGVVVKTAATSTTGCGLSRS